MPDEREHLTLRPTVIGGHRLDDDFAVIREGRRIGRIRLAHERIGHRPGWDWAINPPLPIPSWGIGSAGDLDGAREAFLSAWTRFYGGLTPEVISHWFHHQDAAERRHATV